MPSTTLIVVLAFDAAAAAGLLVLALADPPHGRAELGEALLGAAGAGTLGLAAALHGGHLGLPRHDGLGVAISGSLGAVVFLAALARAVQRGRGGPEAP